jgi:hypothetical protein
MVCKNIRRLCKPSKSQIAANTNDNEIQSRLNTLHATYEKATKDELITDGPTLADLISVIKGL